VPESLHPTQVEEMQSELIVGGLGEVDGTVQGQELQSAKDHQDHPAKHHQELQSAKNHQDHPAKHHQEPSHRENRNGENRTSMMPVREHLAWASMIRQHRVWAWAWARLGQVKSTEAKNPPQTKDPS
jgi:hypothetical protein